VRLPPDRPRLCLRTLAAALACVIAAGWATPNTALAQAASPAAPSASGAASVAPLTPLTPLTPEAVERSVQRLRDEEHFGRKEPERYLRFKTQDKEKKPADSTGAWSWWGDFTAWLADAGRVAVWTLGALGVAVVVVLGLRAARQPSASASVGPVPDAPQRVRQYDIRPETLPDDVGGAAWAQWAAGERAQALALLYRAALSRLVHRHAVPIRTSSTEGDCMRLAARHVPGLRSDFFARVARARLLGGYAGRWPEDAEVQALCHGFDAGLAAQGTAEAPA
jgi:hypothetical protein